MEIKPQAMAIPADTSKLPKGKYGPVFPRTPACHGFTIIAKIIPGREPVFHEYAQNIEKAPGLFNPVFGITSFLKIALPPVCRSYKWKNSLLAYSPILRIEWVGP